MAHVEEAVDHAAPFDELGLPARGAQRLGMGGTLVAQRVELGRHDHGGRQVRKASGLQRRQARVRRFGIATRFG